jgi:hypothetical protein
MNRILASALAAALLGYALATACTEAPVHDYCTDIPVGGCPGLDAMNCEDTTCAAIYSDNDSSCVWTLVQKCPNYKPPVDAGHDGDAADGSSDGSPRDASLRDAGFLLPQGANGGPGCPDLEAPDCPVELALQCAYCCGCQDLYVCVDAGWNLWGECDEGGGVSEVSP